MMRRGRRLVMLVKTLADGAETYRAESIRGDGVKTVDGVAKRLMEHGQATIKFIIDFLLYVHIKLFQEVFIVIIIINALIKLRKLNCIVKTGKLSLNC